MDLIKQLTGKNPDEYKSVAKSLVDNADLVLYKNLVKQDDFLFDFVKSNVANRIKEACNSENYQNLIKFFECYSPSYDGVIAEILFSFGGVEILPLMKEIFMQGTVEQKAYTVKFFSLVSENLLSELLPILRETALSDFEPLSVNSIEVLSKFRDDVFKQKALKMLESQDEFEQYNGVKYLVAYKASDVFPKIIEIMKHSTLSENIASEIPYLISLENLIDSDDGILVLCNIVNAIPEIIPPSAVIDYNLFSLLEELYIGKLTSASAVLLRLAKEKFAQLTENDEYLFDCDKNTKEEVYAINNLLSGINSDKLKSLLYDELFEESDFVFYAIDFVDETEELETLIDSSNPTLILKVLSILKEKSKLTASHKQLALNSITDSDLRVYIEAL